MKGLLIILSLVILVLQVRLMSSDGGISEFLSLKQQLQTLQQKVDQQQNKNDLLKKEVAELQSGTHSIETIARQKLGMVGPDEFFVKVIEIPRKPKNLTPLKPIKP